MNYVYIPLQKNSHYDDDNKNGNQYESNSRPCTSQDSGTHAWLCASSVRTSRVNSSYIKRLFTYVLSMTRLTHVVVIMDEKFGTSQQYLPVGIVALFLRFSLTTPSPLLMYRSPPAALVLLIAESFGKFQRPWVPVALLQQSLLSVTQRSALFSPSPRSVSEILPSLAITRSPSNR